MAGDGFIDGNDMNGHNAFGSHSGVQFNNNFGGDGESGFKPAGQWGFTPAAGRLSPGGQDEDDMDDEERERIAMVEQE